MATYRRETWIDAPFEDVWEFHSTTDGLEALTPDFMNLEIDRVTGPDGEIDPDELKAGSRIEMSMRPFGVGPRQHIVSVITDRTREEGGNTLTSSSRTVTGPVSSIGSNTGCLAVRWEALSHRSGRSVSRRCFARGIGRPDGYSKVELRRRRPRLLAEEQIERERHEGCRHHTSCDPDGEQPLAAEKPEYTEKHRKSRSEEVEDRLPKRRQPYQKAANKRDTDEEKLTGTWVRNVGCKQAEIQVDSRKRKRHYQKKHLDWSDVASETAVFHHDPSCNELF